MGGGHGAGAHLPLVREDRVREFGRRRWNNDDALGTTPEAFDEASSTVFTFTLVAVPEGTELTVVETGFETTSDPGRNMRSHGEGWTLELDKLVALLEGDR
jgi:hypothetical protein